MIRTFAALALTLMPFTIPQNNSTNTPPLGLWQNKEEGIVVRIDNCGSGFCGVAAGIPADSKQNRDEVCGRPMLKDFTWNNDKGAWLGHMQPPGMDRSLDAEIKTDGSTYLTVHAHMMMMSKTMEFLPFKGEIGDRCEIR